jgi:hypothetical protein
MFESNWEYVTTMLALCTSHVLKKEQVFKFLGYIRIFDTLHIIVDIDNIGQTHVLLTSQ